ncbi:MAG: M20 family metallopeptidase [Oscillospiraceae bacterium]|nr:M20 family metallopeptidase [Oscillospiraceae bacterium]
MDIKTLSSLIDNHQDELYALLCNLIRINSENFGSHGNEKDCAAYIAAVCKEMGLETDLYSPMDIADFEHHPDYLPGRNLEERYNVTARWQGKVNEDALMLMGHSDTVVIGDLSKWTMEPLCGDIHDGKIWGRGACDDKYAIATALFLIDLLHKNGFTPKQNVLFTAYSDEEHGGSHGALAAVLKYPTKRIINMDCKDFEIWHCAAGGGCLSYRFHTAESVDNAKYAAAALPIVMEEYDQFFSRRKSELSANPFFADTNIPGTSVRFMDIHVANHGADLGSGNVDVTYYTDRTKDEIDAELAEMEKALSEKLSKIGIIGDGFVRITRFFHYGYSEPDCSSITDLQSAAKEVSGRNLKPCGSCLSDLSVLLKYGSREAYGFGIGRGFGDYGGAHQPDEYIECDTLLEYAKIIGAYIVNTLS